VPPGLRGEIRTRPAHLAALGEPLRRRGILRFLGGSEQVKRPLGPLASGRHPERLEAGGGLRLAGLRPFVEPMGRLMHPAPLPAGLSLPLAQRFPPPRAPSPLARTGPSSSPRRWRSRRRSCQDCSLSREPSQRPPSSLGSSGGAPRMTRRQCRASAKRGAKYTPSPQH
jgi:hypothetical protein